VIGVLDALRFGDPEGPRASSVREIVRGVVDGIWQYGNPLGVPNLGGDVFFSDRYDENCLVNVVALGLVREDRVVRSRVPEAAAREPYVLVSSASRRTRPASAAPPSRRPSSSRTPPSSGGTCRCPIPS
jgi:phosphoribosylformylglycinamidine synthase